MRPEVQAPTGREFPLGEEDIIVSKTDLKGRIMYVNNVFIDISKFPEEELLGKPHNVIRHPDMPRAVFKFLWDRLQSGVEVFSYVLNLCKDGDHYWVYAHMTPSLNQSGEIIGYHSNRRAPSAYAVEKITELYAEICQAEAEHSRKSDAIRAGEARMMALLEEQGLTYDEYIWSLASHGIEEAA